MIPTKESNPKGLYAKYIIRKITGIRTDGFGYPLNPPKFKTKSVEPNSEYFVLRLDLNGGDMNHIKACRIAIHAYADAIDPHIPLLAKDLRERYPLIDKEDKKGLDTGAISKSPNKIEQIMGNNYAIHYRIESFGKSIMIMGKDGLSYFRIYWYSDDEKSIYLEGLSVTVQRSGIGTHLLECAEKIATSLDASTIYLWVAKETWMQDWYVRKGYEYSSEYEEEPNAIWMKKKLINSKEDKKEGKIL